MAGVIEKNTEKSGFFPGKTERPSARPAKISTTIDKELPRKSNSSQPQPESKDAKVEIPDAIKDFSKIRKAVDGAPTINNASKIADLKARINEGSYSVDYDVLAEKILTSEF